MGKVTVSINGYSYDVACEDGQEGRLRELAQHVNRRVSELRSAVGDVGEARLLVMTSILIADEAMDALSRADELVRALESKDADGIRAQEDLKARVEARNQAMATAMINGLAERIETIAERLEQA